MIALGRYAFGHARVRARKGALLGPDAAARLRSAPNLAALARVREELSTRAAFSLLADDYRMVLRSFPTGALLVTALARRHEAENVKLVLRAIAHGWPSERWMPLWRPMGALATVRPEALADLHSFGELREAVAATPWRDLVGQASAADAPRLGAVELAIDRRVSEWIAAGADALPDREREAAELGRAVVRERDAQLAWRASAFGLSPEIAGAHAALGATPSDRAAPSILDLRRQRRTLCRRAFIGSPFRLAPAIAFLLLREEEMRGLSALAEAWGDPALAAPLDEALAAGAWGD